jgi:hypothetical protein
MWHNPRDAFGTPSRRRIMRERLLAIAVLLAVGIDARAQEFTGTIYGRIVDSTLAPVAGVSITLEGDAIQGRRTVESEADGSYRVPYLPQGEYRITYQKRRFKTIVYEGAKVELGKTLTMNVTMQIADVEETVVVTGSSPVVDVRNASVGTNFGVSLLRDIPHQRDVFALLALTPGIMLPRPDVGGNTAGTQSPFRAYGLSGQTIATVDGVNITDLSSGIGGYIDYGAVAEAKIAAAGQSAEVPVAGAAVTTVIRSGGNTHHGEFYTDFMPEGGKGYTGAEKFVRYLDLNGNAGGPLIKDRLWYFTSVRGQQNASVTGMYNAAPAQGGTQGQLFTTQTSDYTVKVNYQLSRRSTLAFMSQFGRKNQPYRFGSGAGASQYLAESTALQNSWSEIGKVGYTRMISNRATLDVSINAYITRFPLTARTDKTPIFDDVTFLHSGAFSTPSLQRERRWHYNTDLTLYADRHDMKVGYMYQSYSLGLTSYGAPGPAGTAGHFFIWTTSGVPTAFSTDNGPVSNMNVLENHALFFQDKFQVTTKLTINYGVRFDQYHSAYPEQRFGLNGTLGPFAVATVTPARDVATFNTVVPRVAAIYDPFGKSKTAFKASWGRFATNPAASIAAAVNPIDLITKKYAWDSAYLTADPALAASRITPAYVATLQPISGGSQLTPATVNPHLKDSYTDEYTLGAEQEIAGNLRGYVTFVRKSQKNNYGTFDRLRTLANYTPVQAVDPGPDGAVTTSDDRTITVWETGVPPDTTDYYLTNKPVGDTYSTIEVGVTKRMSDSWQLVSAFDWTRRSLSSLFSEDPNVVVWNSNNTNTAGWTFKASGSYLFSHGLMISVFYNAMKGEPYSRIFVVTPQYLTLADPGRTTPLAQGNLQIVAEKAGTYYYPAINLVNIRVQKEFTIRNTQRLQLMVNLFNFFDAQTVTAVNQLTGAFGQPLSHLGGTAVRFSTRYSF